MVELGKIQKPEAGMEYTRSKVLVLALLFEGLALAAAFLLAEVFSIELFPLTENFLRDMLVGTLGALFLLAFFALAISEKAAKIPIIGSLRKLMITEVRAIFSELRFPDLVLIAMLAGYAEEMLFRGILQVKFGIVVASILFGLMHFVSPAYVVITIIIGLYIGMFFQEFGSLLIPVQLHFIYDLGALTYLRYFVKTEQ
jgi:membrane protease YdiL (CAAX protease family)